MNWKVTTAFLALLGLLLELLALVDLRRRMALLR